MTHRSMGKPIQAAKNRSDAFVLSGRKKASSSTFQRLLATIGKVKISFK